MWFYKKIFLCVIPFSTILQQKPEITIIAFQKDKTWSLLKAQTIYEKNASRHTKKKFIFCAPQLEFTANKLASLEKVRCSVPPLYYYVKLNNILNVYILRILCAGLKSCFYKTFGTCKFFFFYYYSKHLRKVLSGMFFLMLLAGLDWRLSFNDYNRSCSEIFFVSLWHPRFIFPFPHSCFWKRLYLCMCVRVTLSCKKKKN